MTRNRGKGSAAMDSFESMSAGARTIYSRASFLEDSFIQAARLQLPEGIKYLYTNEAVGDDYEEELGYELRADYGHKVLDDLRTYLFGEEGMPDERNRYSGNMCIELEQTHTEDTGQEYKARAIKGIGSICNGRIFNDYDIADISESSSALFITLQTREDILYRYPDDGVAGWHAPAGCEPEIGEMRQVAIRQLTDLGQKLLEMMAAPDSDTLIDIWNDPDLSVNPDYSSKQAVRPMLEEAAIWGEMRQELEDSINRDQVDLYMDEER